MENSVCEQNKCANGFTLIELMMVIAIVGVLAAIAMPTYYNYIAKAQFSEAMSLASGVKTAVADGYQDHLSLVDLNNGVGAIPAAANISGKYVSHVEVRNGVITSYFAGDSALDGKVAVLKPTVNASSLTWHCQTNVAASRSPRQCESVGAIVPTD